MGGDSTQRRPGVARVSSELGWLAREMYPYWKWHVASLLCIASAGMLSLVDPLVMRWLIDSVLPARNVRGLGMAVLALFVAFQGRVLLATAGGYATFTAGQRFGIALRTRLLRHLGNLSADYHEATPTGEKVFLASDAVQEITTLGTDFFPAIMRVVLLVLCTVGAMFVLNARLTAIVVCLLPLFVAANRRLRKSLRLASDNVQMARSSMASVLTENVSSVLQSQLLRSGPRQLRKAWRASGGAMRAEFRRKRSELRYTVYCSGMTVLSIVLVLGFGGREVIQGSLSIGSLVAFYAYLMRLFDPLYTAVEMNSRMQRIGASIGRIRKLLETEPAIQDSPRATPLTAPFIASLELRDVTFGYDPTRPLVDQLSLRIDEGERVALVGPNGAGKSTLARLMARVYDAQSGKILIDNRDIREIQLSSLRGQLAYLPQHPVLFDCGIEENLELGNPHATRSDRERAVELAELSNVIARLPHGWRQPVGPGGVLLSGGERQKVAIARTLLQKPRILVLDEATSALDASAERAILGRLHRLLPETTIVLITHRLSAVTWVNRLIVLECGRIVATGCHSQIYSRGGIYSRLYDNQSSLVSVAI